MLLSRIPRGMAMAAGTAAMVAGTTFGVAAFADTGPEPSAAVNEAAAQSPADPAEEAPFIAEGENADEGEREEAQAQAEDSRANAADESASGADASVSEKEEKPEPKPESDDKGGNEKSSNSSSGDSGATGASNGGGGEESAVPSGSPREIARGMLADHGWGDDQWSCLDNLWEKESNWDHTAQNASSGAYGIPQSLPGDKMASAGSDWQTNPATQITWGLDYIGERYGSPCGAWSHSQANNWY